MACLKYLAISAIFISAAGFSTVPLRKISNFGVKASRPSTTRPVRTSRLRSSGAQDVSVLNHKPRVYGSALAATALVFIASTQAPSVPFALTLLAYLPCLGWGMPYFKIGSWKSWALIGHRFGGSATLILPIILAGLEVIFESHVPAHLYALTIAAITFNLSCGAVLIKRIPAYDIPTLRAFAVGVSLGSSFMGVSLMLRLGHLLWYEPIGKVFAALSIYAALFAWSDALQHTYQYMRGNFKHAIGKQWFLPFQKPNMVDVFVRNFYRQPTQDALDATVSPANFVVVLTTVLTACFASLGLIQIHYLYSGSEGITRLIATHPDVCRWGAYQALLAVVANNFGTFAGTLVIQKRVSQKQAGLYNAIGLLIPVLNVLAFLARFPAATTGLLATGLPY